jgi:hypothetical protein
MNTHLIILSFPSGQVVRIQRSHLIKLAKVLLSFYVPRTVLSTLHALIQSAIIITAGEFSFD